MSMLQDSTLLSPTSFSRPSRPPPQGPGSKDPNATSLKYRGSLPALSSLVTNPLSVVDDLRQGWDGLSKEERAERVRIQTRKQVLYLHLREVCTPQCRPIVLTDHHRQAHTTSGGMPPLNSTSWRVTINGSKRPIRRTMTRKNSAFDWSSWTLHASAAMCVGCCF
jgi:hypothetical protein